MALGCRTKRILFKKYLQWCAKKARGLSISLFVFVLIGSLVAYIFQVNVATLREYKLDEKKITLNQLEKEHTRLLIAEARLRSMERVGNGIKGLDMEPIDDIQYLDWRDDSVAMTD